MSRVLLSCVVLFGLATTSASAMHFTAASHGSRCRTVVRRIHGKKKRIRICKKAPRPGLPPAGTIAAKIDLGANAVSVAAGDGVVWATTDANKLLRIDPATNKVVATIALPTSEWPENVAYGNGTAWVAVASPDTVGQPEFDSVLRVDPVTNTIAARIHVGHSPEGVAFTPGAVWTANHRSEIANDFAETPLGQFDVSRVSTTSNTEVARVPVETRHRDDPSGQAQFCCGPQGAAATANAVWFADPTDTNADAMVIRVDPVTNKVAAVIPTKTETCGSVAADETAVWVASGCEASFLLRIDPATNQVAARVDTPGAVGSVALGFGSVWTVGPALYRIDPATNKVVAQTKVVLGGDVSVGSGAVWVGSGSNLLRVTPA